MKICNRCHIEKDFTKFNKDIRYKNGITSICKECIKIYNRNRHRTKYGLILSRYNKQKSSSFKRNMDPPNYTKAELIEWAMNQDIFHKLYDDWVKSDYIEDLAPSFDRIDDYLGYTFDNIKVKTWGENRTRVYSDKKNGINNKVSKPVEQYDMNMVLINTFYSTKEAGRQTGIFATSIAKCCRGERNSTCGFIFKYAQTTNPIH